MFDVIILPAKAWYESPVIATLIGFALASLVDILKNHFREQRALEGYEYNLLKETKEILESENADKKPLINDFLNKFYTDLRFTKLESMRLIRDSLDKAKENDNNCTHEIVEIDARLKELSKEKISSKIMKEIKKIKSMFI